MEKKQFYISERTLLLLLLLHISDFIFVILSIIWAFEKRISAWPVILLAILFIGLTAAAIIWILRPYIHYENAVKRYLNSSHTMEQFDLNTEILSPSSKRLLEQLNTTINQSQSIELNKRQAQYLALQNQINPHFLYNTLESIRSEALIAGLDSVAEMTEALARFFRYTISKTENMVFVEEELQNCETYFQIQQYRFGSRLKLHIEYDSLDREAIMTCKIPKLTLQPILENSIIHGTELKIGESNIRIHLELTEKRLIIRVSDDGVGMDDQVLYQLNKRLLRKEDHSVYHSQNPEGGIALINVNNRIKLIFGDEYGLHVYSALQKGTDVDISIPLQPETYENPS